MRIILRKEQLLELNSRKHDRHSRKISRTSFKSKRGQIQPKNALWKKKKEVRLLGRNVVSNLFVCLGPEWIVSNPSEHFGLHSLFMYAVFFK